MPDPFSIGVGIVGILSLAIQISEVAIQFGLDWKDAPKNVKAFRLELQSLQMTLTEMQMKLISNTSFEVAFDGDSSALLSHLKANHISKDSIKEAFGNCKAQLSELVRNLKSKEGGHRLGWERFKAPFLSKNKESAIFQLQRQCGLLDRLVSIDTAVLAAKTHLDLKEVRKERQKWHTTEENQKILRWLSQLTFEEKHRDILSRRHPGTGQWLLESDTFQAWRNGHCDFPPTLWCPGIPGAGKTVLAAAVVHHLEQLFCQDDVAVLYIYYDYKDHFNQTDQKLFASLAKQSVSQHRDLPDDAKRLYSACKRGETSPSCEQCLELLASSITHFRRTFIVLDALDEHLSTGENGYSPQIPILYELNKVQREVPEGCTMLITSREIYSIQEQLCDFTRLDIRANDEDIRSYVNSRIQDDQKFRFAKEIRADPDLAEEMVRKLAEKAQGM
jgi:Cdc6-like AAA superfamily ATPase